MGLSSYGENLALVALLTGRYVSLHTAEPDNAGSDEVSGGSYARLSVSFSASGGNPTVFANTAALEFPQATFTWDTVTHFGVWTALTAGSFIGSGALDDPRLIEMGDTARFEIGDLEVELD
jgi:hypothetical protein